MLGLFGTLNLGARSLQAQQQAVEVTGQNLANVNNPAYARQRVLIQTSPAIDTTIGLQGTGADVVAIQQLRDTLVDRQITSETSVGGYWNAQQTALQDAQSSLGEQLGNSATGTGATSSSSAAGTPQGLSTGLGNLFNAFQSLSAAPSSMTERQLVVNQAQTLATDLNQTSQQLTNLRGLLNNSITSDVASANQLLTGIASLNQQITTAEASTGGVANDLRDLRQQKLESLAKLVNVDASTAPDGSLNVSIGGHLLVSGQQTLDTLQTYDAGGGQVLVRAATSGAALTITGGSIGGHIDARDGALAATQTSLNTLAGQLISAVNTAHSAGYSLTGSTGAAFFSGTDAASIQVNSALVANPELIQAAGPSGAAGDNQTALALAQLANTKIAGLNNQTFSDSYNQSVAQLGQSLATANTQVSDQQAVQTMLQNQRNSVSGVSIDEEMTNLVSFQRAYEASAKLVNTVDQMLTTVINMKQ